MQWLPNSLWKECGLKVRTVEKKDESVQSKLSVCRYTLRGRMREAKISLKINPRCSVIEDRGVRD